MPSATCRKNDVTEITDPTDIAVAVTVLECDAGLDTDDALNHLVEHGYVSAANARTYRQVYFAMALLLNDFADAIRGNALNA